MLLIAVTGPVGSGKTSLLAALAAWSAGHGRPAEGFLARAVGRSEPGRGAASYELQWLRDDRTSPFATRRRGGGPAYVFRDEAQVEVRRWAAALRRRPVRPLVILDEFGPREVHGGGHLAIWSDIRAADPGIVVIAVREGLVDAVAERLGRRFDVVVDVRSPGAWERLRSACREHEDWQRVGTYGAAAGSVEVGLGSALHGLHVPGRGMILSSLQAAVMTEAGGGLGRRRRVVWVPFIAAGLKALSPAGSRLRPMLAITVQGLLFGGGTGLLGWNPVGVGLGAALVGAWAALQGIVLQYLLVGDCLLQAYEAITAWVQVHLGMGAPAVGTALAIYVGLHALAALSAALFVYRRRELPVRFRRLLEHRVQSNPAGPVPRGRLEPLRHALHDVTRPFFWLPPLLIGLVVLAAGAGWQRLFWMVIRAATVGFVLFSVARSFRPRRAAAWLRAHGYWGPALALERALGERRRDER